MKLFTFVIMAFLANLSISQPAFALEGIPFRLAYWVDEGRGAPVKKAMQATFKETQGSIALGYSTNDLWIKVTIEGQSKETDLAIIVEPAFLRNIELYDPAINGVNAEPVKSGRDAEITDENHIGLYNGFIIPSSQYNRDIYLRVNTSTSLTANVSVMTADLATQNSYVQGGLVAVYIAFLLSFGVWALIAWVIRHDALYGLFALRQLFSSAHIFVYFGTLRFFTSGFLTAETRDLIYVFVGCTVASVAGLFDLRLISSFGRSHWLKKAIYLILSLPFFTLSLAWFGYVQTALQLSSIFINIQFLLIVSLTFSAKGKRSEFLGNISLWLVRCGYLVMAAVVVIPLLMYLNILDTSVPVFKMIFLHALISTIILFGLLQIRNRQRDLAEQETKILLSLKDAALIQESSRRQEKESFLSMLTHELRNPLSVIQAVEKPIRRRCKKQQATWQI